jgi:hypothetical protein
MVIAGRDTRIRVPEMMNPERAGQPTVAFVVATRYRTPAELPPAVGLESSGDNA